MDSKTLAFDAGDVEYHIGDSVLCVNPTDATFVEKLFALFKELDGKQSEYEKELKAAKDNVFSVMRSFDAEMRSMIDTALGVEHFCDGVVGTRNIFATSNGFPLWANILFLLLDEMDEVIVAEQKKQNARIKKYTDKYTKKYHN